MTRREDIKRTSLYIPYDLFEKREKSAAKHRRSVNQELLWLAEEHLAFLLEGSRIARAAQTKRYIDEPYL